MPGAGGEILVWPRRRRYRKLCGDATGSGDKYIGILPSPPAHTATLQKPPSNIEILQKPAFGH
jgi:hypothetical protein